MRGLGSFRNVLVIVLLSLTVLPACSTQGPRQTQEQRSQTQEQRKTADRPTRSESKMNEDVELAGQAALIVVVVGVFAAVAAVPLLLVLLL